MKRSIFTLMTALLVTGSLILTGCAGSGGSAAETQGRSGTEIADTAQDDSGDTEEAGDSDETETEAEEPEILTESYASDEIEMPYARIGDGDQILVILPGLSVKQVTPSAAAVAAQYQVFLDNGYTIYLFDRRTNAPEGYTIWDMAEDTCTVMEDLGITQADIFGASQGGMMAECIAITHPELVDDLVLGSTLARHNENSDEVIAEWISLAEDEDGENLVDSFGARVYSEAVWEAYGDSIRAANAQISEEEYARFVTMAAAILDFDCYDRLGEIDADVLVLGSEGDRVVTPSGSEEIAEALDCECYMYDDSYGHGVYDEAADYVSRVYDFCR